MKKRKFEPGTYDLKVKRGLSGLGLYTFSPIKKGECIIEYKGRTITKEEETTIVSQYLFLINKHKTIDGQARSNTARYINHSCAPNCEIEYYKERVWIMAKRNIKPGEELTYDYDTEFFDEYIKPKGCRCAKCTKKREEKGETLEMVAKNAKKTAPKAAKETKKNVASL